MPHKEKRGTVRSVKRAPSKVTKKQVPEKKPKEQQRVQDPHRHHLVRDSSASDLPLQTRLNHAVERNDEETVRFLINEEKPEVSALDTWQQNPTYSIAPLHRAAQLKSPQMVRILLEDFGADVNVKSIGNAASTIWTPLLCALHYGCKESVELLCAHGADVNQESGGFTKVFPIYFGLESVDILTLLYRYGADLDAQSQPELSTLAHLACNNANIEILTELKDLGACLNMKNSKNETPLNIVTKLRKGKRHLVAGWNKEWQGRIEECERFLVDHGQ